jgi:ABC-type iron transport system FetAB ATPase subunit
MDRRGLDVWHHEAVNPKQSTRRIEGGLSNTFAPVAGHAVIEAPLPLLRVCGLRSPHGGPFDLDIAQGECVVIVGRSGAGKSVFLRLLADMDLGAGSVELSGRLRESWSGPQWRRKVVYQAAEPAWWAPVTADHFRPTDAAILQELMPALDLSSDLLRIDIARLSTGERQRFALIRSLLLRPEVLLLDEPAAALDSASTLAMEALLRRRMDAGMAIVLVTHSQEQAIRMSHRTFEMVDRKLRAA